MNDPDFQAGMALRREVLGDDYVDRAAGQATELTAPFQEFITRFAWGAVWTRPGLDRATRSAITIALLTALGHERELEAHIHGALRNGLSKDQIGEVLLHTAVYAGVPASNSAMAVAKRALEGA